MANYLYNLVLVFGWGFILNESPISCNWELIQGGLKLFYAEDILINSF